MTLQINTSAFRLLTEPETDQINGGDGGETVITAQYYYGGSYWGGYPDGGSGMEPHPTLSPDGGGGGPIEVPTCENSNAIIDDTPPADGAKYFTGDYLRRVLAHLAAIYDNNPLNRGASGTEFKDMYTNPRHPLFIDFKDWRTENAPRAP